MKVTSSSFYNRLLLDAGQQAAIAPKRSAIERMARYRPVDFMGKKEDEPSMAENWL